MNNDLNKEWKEFLNALVSNTIQAHRKTTEYEYVEKQQEHIDEILTTNLTPDQKAMVEDILFEYGLTAERETEVVYQQGIADCVCLLKQLGVLS